MLESMSTMEMTMPLSRVQAVALKPLEKLENEWSAVLPDPAGHDWVRTVALEAAARREPIAPQPTLFSRLGNLISKKSS